MYTSKIKKKYAFLLILFTVIFMILFILNHAGNKQISSINEVKYMPTDRDAYAMVKELLLNYLKAPTTAKFPNFNSVYKFQTSPGVWEIEGYVDSQNSFGAMLRKRYKCTIVFDPATDIWELTSIKFSD